MDKGEKDVEQVLLYAGLIILGSVGVAVAVFCAVSRYCIAKKIRAEKGGPSSHNKGQLSFTDYEYTCQQRDLTETTSALLPTHGKDQAETSRDNDLSSICSTEHIDDSNECALSDSDGSEYGFDPTCDISMATSTDSHGDGTAGEWQTSVPQLEYGLEYDKESSQLIVSVIQAKHLESDPSSTSLDSYIKIQCSNSLEPKKQTKVCKGSTNPNYSERHLFCVEPKELTSTSVKLEVYSRDKYARQRLLGHVTADLSTLVLGVPVKLWSNLKDLDQEAPAHFGEILVSLSYRPQVEILTIVAAKIDKVRWTAIGKATDMCLVISLFDGITRKTKKTKVKRCSTQAVFNEAAIFRLHPSRVSTSYVEIEANQLTADGTYCLLGACRMGAGSTDSELAHWSSATEGNRKLPPMWHMLYATTGGGLQLPHV